MGRGNCEELDFMFFVISVCDIHGAVINENQIPRLWINLTADSLASSAGGVRGVADLWCFSGSVNFKVASRSEILIGFQSSSILNDTVTS